MNKLIPSAALTQHVIALGKTGAGKSSTLRAAIVEPLLDDREAICILDPKGDWWGLTLDKTGKKRGYAIAVLGGPHGQIPLSPDSGAIVGEIFATSQTSLIIDMSEMMMGERTRFFMAFAEALFRKTRGRKILVIDECHNFAPQGKVLDPDAGKMLHWANRLASEGRGKGVTIVAASQRPQKVHKDFLTSMETLIALRVIHKLDRDAIKDWIDGCADPAIGKEVMQGLAGLKRGTGWIWSPEIQFGPKLIEFPMFNTYDSFKAQPFDRELTAITWDDESLAELSTRMQQFTERAKENDPAALKKRIRELEAQLKSTPAVPWVDLSRVREEAFHEGFAKGLVNGVDRAVRTTISTAIEALKRLNIDVDASDLQVLKESPRKPPIKATERNTPMNRAERQQFSARAAKAINERALNMVSNTYDIGNGGKRKILNALAHYPNGLMARRLSLVTGLSAGSGTWKKYMSELRQVGYIEKDSTPYRITDEGREALGHVDPLPEGAELVRYWRDRLGNGGKRAIFDVLIDAYPNAVPVDVVATRADLAHGSGTWKKYMSELRGLELVEGSHELRASADLF